MAEHKYSKKKRLLVNLSAPHNNDDHVSMNSLIDKSEFSVSYVRVDDIAIYANKSCVAGANLCKTDIVDASKLIPIRPNLWQY